MDRKVQFIPNPHPDVLGKIVRIQFEVSGKNEWFEGIVATYNGLKGKFISPQMVKLILHPLMMKI